MFNPQGLETDLIPNQCAFFPDHSKNTWQGTAWIPIDYFPPSVTKFNAYAIHGVDQERRYEALFPVPGPYPDFHRLEHFQPIDFTRLRSDNDSADFSEVWKNSLAKRSKTENVKNGQK
jgi:hypothetical protein